MLALSLGHTRHAHEMQQALQILFEKEPPIIIYGEPPARFTARNIDIAKRTWLRHEEFVERDKDDASALDMRPRASSEEAIAVVER